MTVKQAAARLEVSPATVYALIASGKLRCHRIGLGRGVIRIFEEQLSAFLKAVEPLPASALPSPRGVKLRHLRLP